MLSRRGEGVARTRHAHRQPGSHSVEQPTTIEPRGRPSRADAPNAAAGRPPATSDGTDARRSPILLITAVVGGLGVLLVGGLILFGGGQTKADDRGPDHAGEPHAGRARRWPHPRQGRRPGDARGVDRLPVPDLRRVRPDRSNRLSSSKYVTPGTLRIVHHDAAFQGAKSSAAYDESVEAAAGGRCAADQGGYWPFQDWAFANQAGENQGAFAAPRLTAIAIGRRPRRHGLEGLRRDRAAADGRPRRDQRGARRGRERDTDDVDQRPDDRGPPQRRRR